jgi:hypothetical protein
MLKDFVIADAVGIRTQDKYIDLHNEFDLVQIRLGLQERTVELEFSATGSSAAKKPGTILLQFIEVDWIQISPRVLLISNREVLELGYKEASDSDHDWLMREEQASPDAHFFLRLSEDEFVRLHARRAKVVT